MSLIHVSVGEPGDVVEVDRRGILPESHVPPLLASIEYMSKQRVPLPHYPWADCVNQSLVPSWLYVSHLPILLIVSRTYMEPRLGETPETDRYFRHCIKVIMDRPSTRIAEELQRLRHENNNVELARRAKATAENNAIWANDIRLMSRISYDQFRRIKLKVCSHLDIKTDPDFIYRIPCISVFGAVFPIEFDNKFQIIETAYNFRQIYLAGWHVGRIDAYNDVMLKHYQQKLPWYPRNARTNLANRKDILHAYLPGAQVLMPASNLIPEINQGASEPLTLFESVWGDRGI